MYNRGSHKRPLYRSSAAPRNMGGYSGRVNSNAGPSVVPPTGQLLLSITQTDLGSELSSGTIPQITDCEYVASYSWVGKSEPTIYVPGKPPTWTPPKSPQTLTPDAGEYYRDPNAARWPKYPTEPAVRAVLLQSGADDLDLFGCGSTIGNLLRFARGNEHSFKFDVDVIGNTVFLVRKENTPTETIKDVRGYGHTFPEAFTSWDEDVKGSESHQRMIRYNLGGINVLIRFESDGYYKEVGESSASKGTSPEKANVGDIESTLQNLKPFDAKKQSISTKKLIIIPSGQPVPQTAIFDIKTRYYRNLINMDDVFPTLWLKQIPNFVIAYNERGSFKDIRKQELSTEIKEWEAAHANEVRKFFSLIRKIVEYAREMAGTTLEIYRPPISGLLMKNELQIRERTSADVEILPADLKEQWILATANPAASGVVAAGDDDQNGSQDPVDNQSSDDEDISDLDYTYCSEECGYCGHCRHKQKGGEA